MSNCRADCYASTAPASTCECSCGGAHHGRGATGPPAVGHDERVVAAGPPHGDATAALLADAHLAAERERERARSEYSMLGRDLAQPLSELQPGGSTTIGAYEVRRVGEDEYQISTAGTPVGVGTDIANTERRIRSDSVQRMMRSGSLGTDPQAFDKITRIIRQGGVSEAPARTVANLLVDRDTGALAGDLHEAQRQQWLGVDGADEARRWVTAELVRRLGRPAAGALERRTRVQVAAAQGRRVLREWDISLMADSGYGEHPLAEDARDRLEGTLDALVEADFPKGGGKTGLPRYVVEAKRLCADLNGRLPVYQPMAVRAPNDHVPVGMHVRGTRRAGYACADHSEELGCPVVRERVG